MYVCNKWINYLYIVMAIIIYIYKRRGALQLKVLIIEYFNKKKRNDYSHTKNIHNITNNATII